MTFVHVYYCEISGVSIILFLGGGEGVGSKYFWKSTRGVKGHTSSRKFLKWCSLVRFGEYFAKIL